MMRKLSYNQIQGTRGKNLLVLGFVVLALCCGCYQIYLHSPKRKNIDIKHNYTLDVSEKNMMQTVKDVSEFPRPVDSAEIDKVCVYIEDKLKQYSYDVEEQCFYYTDESNAAAMQSRSNQNEYFNKGFTGKITDKKGVNVIARKEDKQVDKKLLLTAHYDSCEGSPGANDNGSGLAILLELARVIDENKYPFSLEFIFFSGEEDFFVGSRYYVSQLDKSDDIVGVINIDTVAEQGPEGYWIMTSEGTEYTDGNGNIDYKPVENSISEVFTSQENYELVCMLNSDHYPFSLKEIPAITIVQNLNYKSSANTVNDTIDTIDSERLTEVTTSVIKALAELNL